MNRKALRDLIRQRTQVAAVAVTVMLGVGLFIASAGAFQNLSGSYHQTYDRLRFADLVATGGAPAKVAAAARDAGATAVTIRHQADPPMKIKGTKLLGRISGLPVGKQSAVNDVDVINGHGLSASDPTGVLVETHAAKTFGLTPGDTISVFTTSGWKKVTVRGIAVSAEYLWPARNRQEVLSDPHAFAVVFASEATVKKWAAPGSSQVLVRLRNGTDDSHQGAVTTAMRKAGAVDVTTQADQPSPATLQLDLDGFSEMSKAFPMLFLSAAAIAGYVLLTRRVRAERPIIGTLMAAGARPSRVVRHYLLQGLLVGLLGSAAGVVVGVAVTGMLTRAYTNGLGIPDTLVSQHPQLAFIGLGFGILVGIVGAVAPALTAARTNPAEAMRNQSSTRPPGWWSRAVSSLTFLPVTGRMALRDVARSRRRTAATALGGILSLVLVLASVGMMTSMTSALKVQYDQVERQDATVTADARESAALAGALKGLPGVTRVELSELGQVSASRGTRVYSTQLQGFAPDTTMHGFLTDNGTVKLPAGAVLAGSALAKRLHVGIGDQITVRTSSSAPKTERIAGLLEEPLGSRLYATNDVANSVLGHQEIDTYLLRYAAGTDRDQIRKSISHLPGVLAYADTDAVVRSFDQFLGLFWIFVSVMVLLGAVLALAIIYVTMTVAVVERTGELATLRAAGVPLRKVGGMIATENLVATLLGVPIGLLLGWFASRQFVGLFNSDLMQLKPSVPWWSLLAAAGAVLLAAGLSQLPAVRSIRRLDIAQVVRERAG